MNFQMKVAQIAFQKNEIDRFCTAAFKRRTVLYLTYIDTFPMTTLNNKAY